MYWIEKRKELMQEFLGVVNRKSDKLILKGGTALMLCYGLDRFSDSLEFDDVGGVNLKEIADAFADGYRDKYEGLSYDIDESKHSIKKILLNYGWKTLLKIEVTKRQAASLNGLCAIKNGVLVYNIDMLFMISMQKFLNSRRSDDLYDILYIYMNYKNELSSGNMYMFHTLILEDRIERLKYDISTDSSATVDSETLINKLEQVYYFV